MPFSKRLMPSYNLSNFWDPFDFPSRICDQHFGLGLLEDDFVTPSLIHGHYIRPRRQQVSRIGAGRSDVKNDDKKFLISLDVSHFRPDEIEVKTVDDNSVIIHGKHEEKQDQHGFISREFTRRYMLPDDVLSEQVSSALTPDGFLMVEAPKKATMPPRPNERVVPITLQEKNVISPVTTKGTDENDQ